MRSSKIFFVIIIIPIFCFSQNKDQLKKQKKAIENEISYTTSLLEKTKEYFNESKRFPVFKSKNFLCSNHEISCVRVKRFLVFESRDVLFSDQEISCDPITSILCSSQEMSCAPITRYPVF